MILDTTTHTPQIQSLFQAGEVFAYPTEAVFGLGGKPTEESYQKIITLKGRDTRKGVILVAAHWEQVKPMIGKLSTAAWQRLQQWEKDGRATTFILPAAKKLPSGLCDAEKGNIAIRVSQHPIVKILCELCDSPLISTSANLSGYPPATTAMEVRKIFPHIPIIAGEVGNQCRPSRIIDLASNQILRD